MNSPDTYSRPKIPNFLTTNQNDHQPKIKPIFVPEGPGGIGKPNLLFTNDGKKILVPIGTSPKGVGAHPNMSSQNYHQGVNFPQNQDNNQNFLTSSSLKNALQHHVGDPGDPNGTITKYRVMDGTTNNSLKNQYLENSSIGVPFIRNKYTPSGLDDQNIGNPSYSYRAGPAFNNYSSNGQISNQNSIQMAPAPGTPRRYINSESNSMRQVAGSQSPPQLLRMGGQANNYQQARYMSPGPIPSQQFANS